MEQNQMELPKILDNIRERVVDDLKATIGRQSRLSLIAASFSVFAFPALKKELSKIKEFRFIFTGNAFAQEKETKEAKEFYISRIERERSLYGNDFEIKLRNELNLHAIARECAEWLREKARFKSNRSHDRMAPFMLVENENSTVAYNPLQEFSTTGLGMDRGDNAYSSTTKLFAPLSQQLLQTFDEVWNDSEKLKDVTETVLDNISNAYKENSPELVYYLALYNIFSEFLDDINEDFLPNEATGFKQSKIWGMLYNFQRDAVLGCISKLEKHNGCILADSVGLGKTFSALGVIKYYESRNKDVLVLCPKRLGDNWKTFKQNYKNNPLASDRLGYDVLYHTDLTRERGETNGIDLRKINWGNYSLVVIDESHNFRNGGHTTRRREEGFENRYQKLLSKVILSGVKTKVLMLSATPVNIDFTDLQNQIGIACEGNVDALNENLESATPATTIFRNANKAFKEWSKLEPEKRTTENLLDMLSFDFFSLLDSVTIARSRKHIETYYRETNIGKFPTRLPPVSLSPKLTDIEGIDYATLFTFLDKLNLAVYTPLKFVHPSKLAKYVDDSRTNAHAWRNRETGRNILMLMNLLKRAESSIHSFRLSAEKISDFIESMMGTIEKFEQGDGGNSIEGLSGEMDESDEIDDVEELQIGRKFKIDLRDMDYLGWKRELESDRAVLSQMLDAMKPITPRQDSKLQKLIEVVREKIANPINNGNRKILLFTAFVDTADYLYANLKDILANEHGLHSALVTGQKTATNLAGVHNDFNEILTCFSPLAKNRDALFEKSPGDIELMVATDCVSEGQNLQDCDFLINYDIHWNPVRIIQRFGRIDRIGSKNERIQLVNFWPNLSLDEYINLKTRVENRMTLVGIVGDGADVLTNKDVDLNFRKSQLERLHGEVVDLEEMNSGVSILDLGLNEFHLDVLELRKKYGDADSFPHGIHAVAQADSGNAAGVVFILKNINSAVNVDRQNRLHPFYLIYIRNDGETIVNHLNPKTLLDRFRLLSKGNEKPFASLVSQFNRETKDGKDMGFYSELLGSAIRSIIKAKDEKEIDSLFHSGGTTMLQTEIKGLNDFELIDFLIVK